MSPMWPRSSLHHLPAECGGCQPAGLRASHRRHGRLSSGPFETGAVLLGVLVCGSGSRPSAGLPASLRVAPRLDKTGCSLVPAPFPDQKRKNWPGTDGGESEWTATPPLRRRASRIVRTSAARLAGTTEGSHCRWVCGSRKRAHGRRYGTARGTTRTRANRVQNARSRRVANRKVTGATYFKTGSEERKSESGILRSCRSRTTRNFSSG